MRVAYLRSEGSEEDIQSAMAALEEVGCDRVVVDSSTGSRPESRTALLTFLNRMKPGDDLVVTRLDQLATSMPRLVEFLAAMMERGIAVETIAGEIDTADPTVSQLIKSLWAFEQRARNGTRSGDQPVRNPRPAGRAGWPAPRSRKRATWSKRGAVPSPRSPASSASRGQRSTAASIGPEPPRRSVAAFRGEAVVRQHPRGSRSS